MNESSKEMDRREFLQLTAAAGVAVASGGLPGSAAAQQVPHPHELSLDFLDRNEYIHNMEVINVFRQGEPRGGKMQLMAVGDRRYLFQSAWRPGGPSLVIDISNAARPEVINDREWFRGDQGNLDRYHQFQLAFHQRSRRWILINGYDGDVGLKGIRILDATNPRDIRLLSEWSTDQGDPSREQQEGSGTHRNYYDGGRYAYLDTQPDDSFNNYESSRANGVQVLDLTEPERPRFVSNWWYPGMRDDEDELYRLWREWGDGTSYTSMHGGFFVPQRVEDGGRYSYSNWGSLGLLIHDVSNPSRLRLVGRWQQEYRPGGGIALHATDVSKLDRGFVISSPEPLQPDCFEPYHDSYVIDVRDPTDPKRLATLPRPVPPRAAPYRDFCSKRGRVGPHNPPHQKAPGRPDPNFYALCHFNAGLQCYDVTFPGKPQVAAYFIPAQGGDINNMPSYFRSTDNVFVEWDRRLIWCACNTGLYLLSTPMLGEPALGPMPVTEWALPGVNRGHDA